MAKHKSATEVTLQIEEKSSFELWILRHWPKFAVLGVILAAGIVFVSNRAKATEATRGAEWNQLAQGNEDLAAFEAASQAVAGTPIEGWARLLQTQKAMGEENLAAAAQATQSLKSLDGHLLNTLAFPIGPDGASETLGSRLERLVTDTKAWEEAHSSILNNPEPPSDAPQVTIKTSEGDIVVALYTDLAPKHCANFLKVAKEDGYDGTKFYRIINAGTTSVVEGGGANTKQEDVATWGKDDGESTVEQEKNGLVHAAGYLASARSSTGIQSAGSRFTLTFGRSHFLDTSNTIFGKVVSGLDVVKEIGTAPVRPFDQTTRISGLPEVPVTIEDVMVPN